MRAFVRVFTFLWLGLGIAGLITENDNSFIVGLVNSVVCTMTGIIMDTIKKENN